MFVKLAIFVNRHLIGRQKLRFLVRSQADSSFGRFSHCHLANDSDTEHYLECYKQQFTNHKMFLHTYSNLNYDIKQK